MKTEQYFGVSGQFSITKLLNILVILSMLLASCGTPEKNAPTAPIETVTSEKEPEHNNYEPPVYSHPEPVVGERPTDQLLSADEPTPIPENQTQEAEQPPPQQR